MSRLSATAIDHARALVLAWLAEAQGPEHRQGLFLAACGRRPPRLGAVPYGWLSERLRGVVTESRRHHLLRMAVDQFVNEGVADAWRSRAKNGRHRYVWVSLKGEAAGPLCPCCGADLSGVPGLPCEEGDS